MTANATENGDFRGESPGTVLRAARLAQNLGVADVARQLKLSMSQVEALEAGEFQRLPGQVFVRGFVRNYARLLKLDAEALVDQATASVPREEPKPATPPSQEIPFPTVAPRRWWGYAVALAVLVAALAAYEFFPSGPQPGEIAATPAGGSAQPEAGGTAAPGALPETAATGPADSPTTEAPP